ncbi:uncharacterized protein LOC114302679 isoform X3 [Camellia sinensis]|uniref:uncharacterized protein LOC114302679 isoform X3 n=1 Tax=Camellia sinensis TaxID=4442 RepID=UPI0010361146|nr:uncharacterized protein LOC114302679 isoform X3 [Camellia sinensis]
MLLKLSEHFFLSLPQREREREREGFQMVLSRLLQVKSRLHLQRIVLLAGLVKATRLCSSSSCSNAEIGNSKKPGLSKEQRAVAVESFVKKYMEAHPGIFPKPTHVQNNVGGSWYTLKDILTKIKEKLLENSQLQNRTTSDTSDSTVDATTSEIITTHNSKGNSELGKPTSTVINSECNNNISSTATSCMLEENFSKKIINATAFEIVQTCGIADHTELCESESIVQSLKSLVNSENNEKNTTHVTSNISEECSSPDAVNREAFKVIRMHNYADSLKHAEPACKVQLSEAEVISRSNEKDISTGKEKNNSEFGEPIVPSSKTSLNTNDNEKNTTPSISFDGAQKISGLADLFMRRMNNRAAGQMTGEKDDSVTINSPEYSNEATRRDMVKSFDIKSLIDCLKEHRKEQSIIKSHDNMGMESNNFKESGGDPGTRVPFNVSSTNSKSGDKEESDADIAAFDYIESKPSPQTKEGMQNVIVEAASSTENLPNKTSIPNLIGDPDVPSSLVKNPTRTVMIKQLTPDIRSHDIEEALAFCGSNISGIFFGSSSFVAYVEFETEDAKERALEKHSINVRGKQLLIFRIDVPRTTVVRISNLYSAEAKKKLFSICRSYGKVKVVVFRHKEIRDVHFMLSEWPNMLKILNRLNGLKVDDCRIIAQPALVFPPEVLRVLWSHPDERQRLETKIWMKTLLYTRLTTE